MNFFGGKLDEQVLNLKHEFVRTHSHLDWLSAQIHANDAASEGTSAIEVFKRMQALKRRIALVDKRREKVKKAGQAVVKSLVAENLAIHKLLAEIRPKAQISSSGIPENVLEDFAKSVANWKGHTLSPEGQASVTKPTSDQKETSPSTTPSTAKKVRAKRSENPVRQKPKAKKSKTKSTELKDMKTKKSPRGITKEMFKKIGKETRGRVKIEALNTSYKKLFEIYNKDIKDREEEELTYKQLGQHGLKLTSATGRSMVNCLRSLKLVSVTGCKVKLNRFDGKFHNPI